MFRHLKRALASNLQTVAVQPREADKLCSQGVSHETLHRFLVWRRSVFFFIAVVTLTSAAMNSINDATDPDDPVGGLVFRLGKEKQVELPAMTMPQSRFAELANNIMGVLLYALPLSALGAAVTWKRWRRSRRFLLAGWLIGFLVPMVLALTPLSWREAEPGNPAVDFVYGVIYGFTWLVLLLPAVLSLLPGMVQACLRIKTLLPESIIPGWILVAAAPFYSSLLLIGWVVLSHLVTNYYLLIGMLLWIVAPLVYVLWARVLVGPLVTEEDRESFRRVQLLASGLYYLSMVLLLIFLFTLEILGVRLVGVDPQNSLLRPWVVIQYLLEYWGRALFITVLAADFFMRVNYSIWRAGSAFRDTPAATEYQQLMEHLKAIG